MINVMPEAFFGMANKITQSLRHIPEAAGHGDVKECLTACGFPTTAIKGRHRVADSGSERQNFLNDVI
ncbi:MULTISPECIES: hypothetical protein [Enterobacteriaceae]|nr:MULTISPECIES: hypothetical protein [Enterobacteriaceae]